MARKTNSKSVKSASARGGGKAAGRARGGSAKSRTKPARAGQAQKKQGKSAVATAKKSGAGRPARSGATSKVAARKGVTRRAGAAGVRARAQARGRTPEVLFSEGVERAMQGYLFDAIALFSDAIDAAPKGPLADDALFNVGATYLRMRLVNDAEKAFTRLLQEYPDSTIDSVYNGKEQGRTAAKALLGRMQARLAQGKVAEAMADREALRAYDDSWVVDPSGAKKSFHDLARAVMGE